MVSTRSGDFLFSHGQERDVNEERMPERKRAQGKRKVWDLMRYVKSDSTRSDVHLWSPAPALVNRGYHEIRGSVKATKVAAASFMFDLVRGPCCAIIRRLTKHKTFRYRKPLSSTISDSASVSILQTYPWISTCLRALSLLARGPVAAIISPAVPHSL